MSGIHDYCRGQVRLARFEAEEKEVHIPKISISTLSPDEYSVFIGAKAIEVNGCCRYEAKSIAMMQYIDEAIKAEG